MIMKRHEVILIILILTIISLSVVKAQDKRPLFIGVQPSITKETFYEKDEFDVNIVPLVLQVPVGRCIDLRATTEVNYHFGDTRGISDIGVQFVLPVYFQMKENTKTISHGFYAGPVLGIGQNQIDDHNTITLAVEPGYMFMAKRSFTLSLGIQVGASYFDYFNKSNTWYSHLGFKINVGFWVNRKK